MLNNEIEIYKWYNIVTIATIGVALITKHNLKELTQHVVYMFIKSSNVHDII